MGPCSGRDAARLFALAIVGIHMRYQEHGLRAGAGEGAANQLGRRCRCVGKAVNLGGVRLDDLNRGSRAASRLRR